MAENLHQTGRWQRPSRLPSRWRESGPVWWAVFSMPVLLFLAIPVLLLFFEVRPADLWMQLGSEQTRQAVVISMKTSLISLAIILLLGTPLAYLTGRFQFRGRAMLETLIDLPTVLPPSVAGLALLLAFGRRGLLGAPLNDLGLQIAFTQAAVVGAQVFVAGSLYIRSAAIGFALIDPEILEASQLDGASTLQQLRHVVLPLSRYALLSGAVMSWSRALGEFGATILFAGNLPGRTQTMPLAIYLGFESSLESAVALSILLVLLSSLALLGVRWLSRGRMD